jgi:hypothetical protein
MPLGAGAAEDAMHVTTPNVDLTAVTEALTSKVREVVPDQLLAKAEHSELGSQLREFLHSARAEGGEVATAAADAADEVAEATVSQAAASVAAVKEAAMSGSRSGGRVLRAALGVLLVGAAVGGGYYVWRKRQSAADEHLSGEGAWGTAPPAAEFQPGMADLQSPDVVDEAFAAEVDAEANEFAEDLVDSVDLPQPQAPEAAEPGAEAAEAFEEGMAATQSPETVDDQFAAEIDAAADDLSQSIVEGIEEPKS